MSVPTIMLKISVVDTPTEHRIVLVGKLAGPWIKGTARGMGAGSPATG
jgi:hypothetical protein